LYTPGLCLTVKVGVRHAESMLGLGFKRKGGQKRHHSIPSPPTLVELREGEHGVIDSIELPAGASRRLMELGFLPGSRVTAASSAPSGDPRVFRVDGMEVALRLETAACLKLRPAAATGD
jgi:ferrous iron transport protein A